MDWYSLYIDEPNFYPIPRFSAVNAKSFSRRALYFARLNRDNNVLFAADLSAAPDSGVARGGFPLFKATGFISQLKETAS